MPTRNAGPLSALPTDLALSGPRPLGRRIARRLLAIAPRETSFAVRGFRCDDAAIRERLEGVARCFVRGYHTALESAPHELAERLDGAEPAERGFVYEGAAMALALCDLLTFTSLREGRLRRLGAFLAGPGDPHTYIAHVGAGWVLGRLPLAPRRLLAHLDPVLGWLALDGYGFHEAFFHAGRTVRRQEVPRKVQGYARRAFDQGVGRCLWFVEGADPERIAATIGAFPEARRPDLWSGAGLAATYAAGRDAAALAALRQAARPWTRELAQGAVFAAAARHRAGNATSDNEMACRALCGRGIAEATAVSDAASDGLPALPREAETPAFELWRRRIQESFAQEVPS